jgi:flagellar biogenesis protein FliO
MASRAVADVLDLPVDDEADEVQPTNYALRLTEALEAISAAQPDAAPAGPTAFAAVLEAAEESVEPEAAEPAAAEPAADAEPVAVALDDLLDLEPQPTKPNRVAAFLDALDKLPPIKLPIGPAIPWRVGLPLLVGVLLVTVVMYRPAPSEPTGVKLPAQATYAVQEQSPLFTKPAPEAQAPIGVQEPAATSNVDFFDMGIKFAAVLALAYGSLMLLKRFGTGAGLPKGSTPSGMRVVSSLALAPNRSVHVLRTPDGKSLLLGATPSQVNLIADLGELSDDALVASGGSFFDVLAGKLAKAA